MEDDRERQATELLLFTTMYPSEFTWQTNPPPNLDQPATLPNNPSFSLTIHPNYTLEFSLPDTYPSTSRPNVYLSCTSDIDTSTRKLARAKLADLVEEQDTGIETLDLIVTLFTDQLPSLTPTTSTTTTSTDSNSEDLNGNHDQQQEKIKRITIWSHHLLATSKRKDIQAWSKELSLAGYSRPGHPGSIFAEGRESDINEFVRRLKQLRWQALQVRGEESAEKRLFGSGGNGIVEVEGLGDIAEELKRVDADSADLFLQAMKIAKTD